MSRIRPAAKFILANYRQLLYQVNVFSRGQFPGSPGGETAAGSQNLQEFYC